jgi:NAD(P)H-nitrite reductase large subunit
MKTKYLIIGNSVAGISAVEAIREIDKEEKIILVSDEKEINYSRPLISYLLGKKIDKNKIFYRPDNFYQENQIELILDRKAIKLDVKKREIILSDSSTSIRTNKQRISFDKLLIATGGTPIIPEIKNKNLSDVFTFTKLKDAEDIAQYIKTNKVKKAVVIGGGLIGLKATEALLELGIGVTIIELADRILSATFDQKSSLIIEESLKKIGCRVITGNTVTQIKGIKKAQQIILKDRTKISAELIILAIGVKPNVDLVKGTPIKINKGILVNDFMRTNVEGIYAAGDCAEGKDILLEMNRPIAIWPVSGEQGKIAGYNLSGRKVKYNGSFLMNSVELAGIPTISVGLTNPTEEKNYEIIDYFKPEELVYKKVVIRNNRIVGTIFIKEIDRAGIYTGLIRDKIDVSSFKQHLLKEDFGLIFLPKEYRKHLVSGEGIEV